MNRRETRGAPPFFDHDWPAFVPDGVENKVSSFLLFIKQLLNMEFFKGYVVY